jgi:cell division protein FtsW (lipid II flippase)
MSPKAIRLRGYGFLVFGGLAVTVTVVGVFFPDLFEAVVIAAVLLWIAVIVSFAWEYFSSTKPQSDR